MRVYQGSALEKCVKITRAIPIAELMVNYVIYLNSAEKLIYYAMENVEEYLKKSPKKSTFTNLSHFTIGLFTVPNLV